MIARQKNELQRTSTTVPYRFFFFFSPFVAPQQLSASPFLCCDLFVDVKLCGAPRSVDVLNCQQSPLVVVHCRQRD